MKYAQNKFFKYINFFLLFEILKKLQLINFKLSKVNYFYKKSIFYLILDINRSKKKLISLKIKI